MDKTHNMALIQPFNMVISGASNTGKSNFVKRLIEHSSTMISPPVEIILWCYNEYSEMFKEIKGVTFHKGFDESIISKEKLKGLFSKQR